MGTSVVTVSLLAFCYCPETGVSLSNTGCLREIRCNLCYISTFTPSSKLTSGSTENHFPLSLYLMAFVLRLKTGS